MDLENTELKAQLDQKEQLIQQIMRADGNNKENDKESVNERDKQR